MLNFENISSNAKIIKLLDFWGIECVEKKRDIDLFGNMNRRKIFESLLYFEDEKNTYKKTLLEKHSESYYIQNEKNNITKCFNALKLEDAELVKIELSTNPLLRFYKSHFAFYFNTDSMTNYEQRDVEYIFLPKYIPYGKFIIDDFILNESFSKIKNLLKYQHKFTITELTQEIDDRNKMLEIISLIKYLLLNQFIIIK